MLCRNEKTWLKALNDLSPKSDARALYHMCCKMAKIFLQNADTASWNTPIDNSLYRQWGTSMKGSGLYTSIWNYLNVDIRFAVQTFVHTEPIKNGSPRLQNIPLTRKEAAAALLHTQYKWKLSCWKDRCEWMDGNTMWHAGCLHRVTKCLRHASQRFESWTCLCQICINNNM